MKKKRTTARTAKYPKSPYGAFKPSLGATWDGSPQPHTKKQTRRGQKRTPIRRAIDYL